MIQNVSEAPTLLRRESLTEQTARAIREAILNGTYSLGQKLRESELVQRFGASSSVIREALHLLQGEGIITTRPYCGRSVFSMQPEEAGELVIMRASLESYAAYLSAKKVTAASAELVLEAAARMLSARPQNYSEWVDRELGFHSAVWEAAGNEWLARQLKQFSVPMLALQIVDLSGAELDVRNVWEPAIQLETSDNPRGHQALARAIASGHASDARQLMVRHIAQDFEDVAQEMFGV